MNEFDDTGAQSIRTHWFRYLDRIEPIRGDLYGFCYSLTGNIWDAEDLVQDVLLAGFGMVARGDFHGETSPVRNARAYLFRTATNRWLDLTRKQSRLAFSDEMDSLPAVNPSDPAATHDAISKSLDLASPSEFVAILLKDVYDFHIDEIADFIGTSQGTIKSALSRARRKMETQRQEGDIDPELKQLVSRFVQAMNENDVDQVVALMAEHIQFKVCNVGGGRGNKGIWTEKSIRNVFADYAECDGLPVVLMFEDADRTRIRDVLRIQGDSEVVTITDYCYSPDTLNRVAEKLGYTCNATAYHQPWPVIEENMVPTTSLPWRE